MLRAVVVLCAVLAAPAAGAQTPPIELGLPLDCVPGETCWIVNFVDVDPAPGRLDYRCGWLTYNGHKGTDIAIRDLAEMRKGVAVFAAAPGTVIGARDGMEDISVKELKGKVRALKGKDCGNGVHIRNAGGWTTQYCHMRKGSVLVRTGDTVKAGQQLGLVGLSGRTEFPHLHLTVRHDKKVVDPFLGLDGGEKCAIGRTPLWKPDVLAALEYRTVHLYSAGFTDAKIERRDIRNGLHRKTVIRKEAPLLILWVDTFWPRPGDEITFTLTDASGRKLFEHRKTVKRKRPRSLYSIGLQRKKPAWPVGTLTGEIRLVRKSGVIGREEYSITRQVTIR